MSPRDLNNICFVVMPFGRKPAGPQPPAWRFWARRGIVDFDFIYKSIFEPAVRATPLPEGGMLQPYRADQAFHSGNIETEMFEYLEYSRFVLCDISSVNANVFLELGVRYRARESGTVLFRQLDVPMPFDITQVRAFPYEYEPETQAADARTLVTRVLTESLRENRLDSPVMQALRQQRTHKAELDSTLRAAEDAIRALDTATASRCFDDAIRIDPTNPLLRLKLGLLHKDQGNWQEALAQFERAAALSPDYADAHREMGIAQNKLYHKAQAPPTMPNGEAALRRAVALRPTDFDAYASLGGVLKREKRYAEAYDAYHHATELSNGNSYPLLNEIKLQVRAERSGAITLDERRRAQLERAERPRLAQVSMQPPYDPPWSFFDLAEIRLYQNDDAGFLQRVREGIGYCTADWQPATFRQSLELLIEGGVQSAALTEAMTALQKAEETRRKP